MLKSTLVTFCVLLSLTVIAQGTLPKGASQLNGGFGFSSFGVPVYIGADFGIHETITIGPRVSYRKNTEKYFGNNYNQSLTVISFNGNYQFNKLLNLPDPWNLYTGLTIGYYLWSDVSLNGSRSGFSGEGSGLGVDAQIGGRYFFTKRLAVNLEIGGGTGSGGNIGITYKLQ
ncbi:MAG: outer membrane beta-barrel protein [Cyclobacteriaceae bacterium]|nr:outer membrane beta-barrel protein [Cyclobacteriaceae bacterium]